METLGSKALIQIAAKASTQRDRADLVIAMLREHLPPKDLPSQRSVINWMTGKSLPNERARRALHELGIGWGTWLIPANLAEVLYMSPP
jgi:uncharacterized protein (DUF2126 family)